jgi:Protein of unknown function (DUF4038)/Putative collagen-binding domain of a collagenase/Fibronectin type III domain/Putative Ig domain
MRTCRAATATLLAALLAACGTGIVGSNTDAGGPPPPTVPAAPTGVTAVAGIRSATVSWGVPSSDGGSAVQGYTVSIAPSTSSAVVAVTGTAASVTGLSNGAAYTFSVSAFNAVGTGPASSGASITTPDVPGAPTSVVATAGNQSANLSWTNPASTGGSAISGYAIAVSPATPSAVFTVTGTVAAVASLANGTAYTFTVAAVNAVGTGPASAPSNAVTPAAPTVAPSNLAYSNNPAVYTVGTAIPPNFPSSSGGAVATYSVAPALPSSLSLSAVTGVITGTPTAVSSMAAYVVTASNAVGSTTASLSITVNAAPEPPSNLTYASNPAVYIVGTAISPNVASSTGGVVASYSVSPALPASLSLSAVTGVIAGTPTAVSSMAAYVVTASNAVGSTTASLSITVNAAPEPPSNLTYSNNPAVYTAGTAISPNVPSSTGGVVASYSVSPALPAQLSLNTSTGVVTGTPMAASAVTAYLVTASNSVGSTTASLSITVNAATTTGMFPLAISADKNGLVTAGGAPFVMTGDAAWSAIAQLDQTDALMYLNDRQSRGFNTILVNLVEHSFTSHTPNWRNAEGQVPFTGTVPGSCPNTEGSSVCNDMSTTNDAYFEYADWFLQQALARNMLVLLAPAYMGYAGAAGTDGWFNDMSATGTAKLSTYGSYLGARYNTAAYPNIIWVNGCDYTPTTSQLGWVTAIVNGMKDAGATQLMTAHWGGEPSFPGYGPSPRPPWLDVDTVYVTSPPDNYQFTLQGWQADNGVRPVFFIEGPYENEYTPPTSPLFLRSDMYQPLFSGEVGFVFGVDPVWNFWDGGPGLKNEYSNDGLFLNWQSALPSPGGMDAVRAAQFMAALGTPKLIPDVNNTFVTAGYSRGSDYALAARTSDGRLAVVYFTNTLTITVSMSQMAGSTTARWFDPSNASYTTVSGSPFPNSGQATFTPPGRTADGSTDWVLVLQVS